MSNKNKINDKYEKIKQTRQTLKTKNKNKCSMKI